MGIEGKRIFVAGHRGMVGSAIVRRLEHVSCELLMATRGELDLTDASAVENWMQKNRPDVIFVAAAVVGGIAANDSRPVDFLRDNLSIELNVISSAHRANVEKLIFLGSSCIYPKFAEQPIVEDALLTGALEPTNEWYALAKIAGIKLCQAYHKQYDADFISVMPCNLYGINDNFDLTSSHVLPALIRKAHDAKLNGSTLTVWGSGKPKREFLYVDDAADACVFLAEHYSGYDHMNVGYGTDVTIAELVEIICDVIEFDGKIAYDSDKPDGTPRKLMDSTRLFGLGWSPKVDLRQGIQRVYKWYLEYAESLAKV